MSHIHILDDIRPVVVLILFVVSIQLFRLGASAEVEGRIVPAGALAFRDSGQMTPRHAFVTSGVMAGLGIAYAATWIQMVLRVRRTRAADRQAAGFSKNTIEGTGTNSNAPSSS